MRAAKIGDFGLAHTKVVNASLNPSCIGKTGSFDMLHRPQGSANEFSELGLEELGLEELGLAEVRNYLGLAEVWNYLGLIA